MSTGRAALVAELLALTFTLGLVLVLGPSVVRDSGGFAVVLFGVPLLFAVVALLVSALHPSGHVRAGVTVLAGVAALAWGLVTALGFGFLLLVPGLLLLLAGVLQTVDATEDVRSRTT